MIYEEQMKPTLEDFGKDGRITEKAVLRMLENIAAYHSDTLGYGVGTMDKTMVSWILLEWKVDILRLPKYGEWLRVTTWSRGKASLFTSYRDFEIHNSSNCLAKVASVWSLVDITNGKLIPISTALANNPEMQQYQKRETDLEFNKIKQPDKVDIEKIFEIRYDDIDVNRHVNNCNYIIWAFEPLSFEFRSTRHLKVLDIVFKKEIKLSEVIVSKRVRQIFREREMCRGSADRFRLRAGRCRSEDFLLRAAPHPRFFPPLRPRYRYRETGRKDPLPPEAYRRH